jgi:hypothetical protein
MADQFFSIKGIEAFLAKIADLPKALARKALRPSLLAGAYVVQKATVEATPRLAKPVYRNGKLIRTPGLLKSRIKVRTSKDATRAGNIGVFVNVKPAAEGQRGKYSPLDPFFLALRVVQDQDESGQTSRLCPVHANRRAQVGG